MVSQSINPYEPPRDLMSLGASATDYYGIATTRLTLAEYRRISRGPVQFLVAALLKLLRIECSPLFGWTNPAQLCILEPNQLPPRAHERLQPVVAQGEAAGFHLAFYYAIPSIGPTQLIAAAMLGEEGTMAFGIAYACSRTAKSSHEFVRFVFSSYLTDGTVVASVGAKQELQKQPDFDIVYYAGKSVAELLDAHRQRLLNVSHASILAIHNDQDLERLVRERELKTFEYHVRRGILRPLLPHEVERLTRQPAIPQQRGFLSGTFDWTFIIFLLYGTYQFVSAPLGAPIVVPSCLIVLGSLGLLGGWFVRTLQRRANA